MYTWHQAFVRVVILAAAVFGLVQCPSWVEEAYRSTQSYKQAPLCPAGRSAPAEDDCVAQAKGEVVEKRYWGCASEGCPEDRQLLVRHGEDTTWLSVRDDIYSRTDPGARADLRLWHGTVVRMEVGGRTMDYLSSSGSSLMWRLTGAWLLLGVAVWTVVVTRPLYLIAFVPGWLLLTLPFDIIVDAALVGKPGVGEVVFAGPLGLLGLFVLVFGMRKLASEESASA